MTRPPLVSFVVTSRNDDHGGRLRERMQVFLDALVAQCNRHGLDAELLMVEWNPPADRPRLIDALRWPRDPGRCTLRILEVSNELHRRFAHSQALPLFQMIAKNVGIRRARGRFVCATNIDVVLNDELVRFLASGQLRAGRMYRVDRWDCASDVPLDRPVEEQLEYCRTHLIRVNAVEGSFPLTATGRRAPAERDVVAPGTRVFFGPGWFQPEALQNGTLFRWLANDAVFELDLPPAARTCTLSLDVEPGPSMVEDELVLELREPAGRVLARARVDGRTLLRFSFAAPAGPRPAVVLHVQGGGRRLTSDTRLLNARVQRVTLALDAAAEVQPPDTPGFFNSVQERTGAGAPTDVLAGDGVKLGRGWYDFEDFAGESFRWLDNDGELLIRNGDPRPHVLRMLVAPGPGLGRGWCVLTCLDERDEVLAACRVTGRQEVRFVLPGAAPGTTRRLRLRVLGGGAPAPGDPRRLNLRVLRATWQPARAGETANGAATRLPPALLRSDIVAGAGLRLGEGWLPFECRGEETFRWLGDEAELCVQGVQGPATLVLEVEPGPSAARTARLHVRDAAGRELAQEAIDRRRTLSLQLPPEAVAQGRIRLAVPGGRAASWRDRRHLNLRVLGCGIAGPAAPPFGTAASPAPPAPTSPPAPPATDEAPQLIHTNACGDFTLMAREHWFALRGYPELEVFSMNIDSFTCYAAHYGGAPEEVLPEPMRIYHIEHATGSGWTPEGEKKLYARIAAKGIPIVGYEQILAWARQMRDQGPLIFNGEGWGLADHQLPETVITSP